MTLEKYTLQKYTMIILIMTTTMMIIILITLIRLSWHLLMQGAGCWCQNWNKPDKFLKTGKNEFTQNWRGNISSKLEGTNFLKTEKNKFPQN